jgi:hypothetical protein
VTNQNRRAIAPAGKALEQEDHVAGHVVEPVAAAGGEVEAGGLTVSAGVWGNNAVIVTPSAHRVRPAQA